MDAGRRPETVPAADRSNLMAACHRSSPYQQSEYLRIHEPPPMVRRRLIDGLDPMADRPWLMVLAVVFAPAIVAILLLAMLAQAEAAWRRHFGAESGRG